MSGPENPPAFPAGPGFDPDLLNKFVQRIDAGDWSINQCWNWNGYINSKGYGVFAPSKKVQYRAHRFALYAYLGRETEELVLHSCDNRACVNPTHLNEGTHQENMAQMTERRRAARGPRHPKAKLTTGKAIAINILYRNGDYSTRELAGIFGMHQSSIAAIISGQLWPDAFTTATRALSNEETGTLRDMFAGQALSQIVEKCAGDTRDRSQPIEAYFAARAYALADAMLAARTSDAAPVAVKGGDL